jgi:hypothetical protein
VELCDVALMKQREEEEVFPILLTCFAIQRKARPKRRRNIEFFILLAGTSVQKEGASKM